MVPSQIEVKKNEDLQVVVHAAESAVTLQVLVQRSEAPVLPLQIDKLTVT